MSLSYSSSTSSSITVNASYTGVTDNAKFYVNGNYDGSRTLDGTNTTHSFSYTYSGLNPSTSYSLTVHFYSGGTDLGSNTITASTAAPPAPSSLTGLSGSSSGSAPSATLNFSWNASSNATSYSFTLYKNGIALNSGSVPVTSVSFSGEDFGQYYLTVTPYNGSTSGSGATSNTVGVRPQSFSWTGGDKVSGTVVSVSASDWNTLTSRINDFRKYKGLTTRSFAPATTGYNITAYIYNDAANGINDMSPSGGTVSTVTKDVTNISAYAINRLSACLNSIT